MKEPGTVANLMGQRMDEASFQQVEDAALLQTYANIQEVMQGLGNTRQKVEGEIMRRMQERGASAIPDSTFVCEAKYKTTYLDDLLAPLKEIFLGDDLAKAWSPTHEETVTVPERWDKRVVLALARKYGEKAMTVVEQAKLSGISGITFEKKTRK